MALTIGNKTFQNPTPNASSYTFAHNQNVGNGKYLLVSVCMGNGVTFSGATYNGVAMTLLHTFNSTSLSQRWAIYGLATIHTGSNNVVLTFGSAQYNPISIAAISFTGSKGVGVITSNDLVTSPNSQVNKYNPNSLIYAFGVSGTNQTSQYTINGSDRAFEFLHNTNSIVRGALFSSISAFGDAMVTTKADSGGSISNTRIEILDYTAGLVAVNTAIGGNVVILNEFKKGLIAINTRTEENKVFNTFCKGFIGITTEVTPHLGIQNKTDISQNFNN